MKKKNLIKLGLILSILTINISMINNINVNAIEEKNKEIMVQKELKYINTDIYGLTRSSATLKDGSIICVGNGDLLNSSLIGYRQAYISKIDKSGNEEQYKFIGGNNFDYLQFVTSTSDGGFIVCGYSDSTDWKFTNKGKSDAIVVKYDKELNEEWFKSYGGNDNDYFYSVIENKDGNYIVVGYTGSTNMGFTNKGSRAAILYELDKNGNKINELIWDGNDLDEFFNIIQTSDGGYLISGRTSSSDKLNVLGLPDGIILKYDKDLNEEWLRYCQSDGHDKYGKMYETKNGDFVCIGSLNNKSIVEKYDKEGNLLWNDLVQSNYSNYLVDIIEQGDEYLVFGNSSATDLATNYKGSSDIVVVKYSSNGERKYVTNLGTEDYDELGSVVPLDNDEYIILANSDGNINGVTCITNRTLFIHSKEIDIIAPTVNKLPNNKIEIIDNNPEDNRNKMYYRINYNSSLDTEGWIDYIEPFDIVYDESGNFNLEVKAVNIYNLESDLITYNKITNADNVTILFSQPDTLEFSLSDNNVNFGEIAGLVDTELEDCITATVSSSLPFTISAKGDDFVGSNEGDIIPISKLQVKLGNEDYKSLANDNVALLTDSEGVDKTYPISLNLQATKGYKLDNYRTDLTFTVSQN